MALIEQIRTDRIEIVGAFNHIQIRQAKEIVDDETLEVKASKFHRFVVLCGDDEKAAECGVVGYSNIAWTPEVRQAYIDSIPTVEGT